MTHEQVKQVIEWATKELAATGWIRSSDQLATAFLEAHPVESPDIADENGEHNPDNISVIPDGLVQLVDEIAYDLFIDEGMEVVRNPEVSEFKEAMYNCAMQFASEVAGEKERKGWNDGYKKGYQDAAKSVIAHEAELNNRISELQAEVRALREYGQKTLDK